MPEWLLPVILLAVVALLLALLVVAWIRIRWRSRSFTAVSGAVVGASPAEVWRALVDADRPPMPDASFDAISWLERLDDLRSPSTGPARALIAHGSGPGGVEIEWTVLDDARPESIAYRYEIGKGIFRGIAEVQVEPIDAGADDAFDESAGPTRIVVIHHCDPTWQEGRALARQSSREYSFGLRLLAMLAARVEADTGEAAREFQRLGVQFVRGPLVPRGDIPV